VEEVAFWVVVSVVTFSMEEVDAYLYQKVEEVEVEAPHLPKSQS